MDTLLLLLAASLLINIAMFLIAFKLKSDKLTDISYAVTFIVLAGTGFLYSDKSMYLTVLLMAIVLWAVRIGGFLLYRVILNGKDQRFDGMREDFVRFARFWLTQGLAVWVILIPALMAFSSVGNNALSSLAILGLIIFTAGLAIESLADFQKHRFSRDASNKNKWIETGIWRYSRHPNYFGEILVWVGVYVYSLQVLSPGQMLVGIVSPLFITTLLLFISGIPILEKSADKRWGNNKAYQAYKRRTSLLVPLPKSD